eukprot:3204287-Rhodomonas_salina.1
MSVRKEVWALACPRKSADRSPMIFEYRALRGVVLDSTTVSWDGVPAWSNRRVDLFPLAALTRFVLLTSPLQKHWKRKGCWC